MVVVLVAVMMVVVLVALLMVVVVVAVLMVVVVVAMLMVVVDDHSPHSCISSNTPRCDECVVSSSSS